MKIVRIKFGMVVDEDNATVGQVVTKISEENAELLLREQGACALIEQGDLVDTMINAYARLQGYEAAWFIRAYPHELREVIPGVNMSGEVQR